MLFQHILRYIWWFQTYYEKKMVDYQKNLDQWLEDATVLSFEPVDYQFNFDDIITDRKTNNGVDESLLGLPSLEWLDEKVDFSVFDSNNLFIHPNETGTLMVDDVSNLLLGFSDSNPATSYLSSDISKDENNILKEFDLQNFQSDQASSEIFDSHLASPGCNTVQVNSPNFASPVHSPSVSSDATDFPLESIFSGSSDAADIPLEALLPGSSLVIDIPLESVQNSPICSQDSISSSSVDVSGNADSKPAITVTVCNQVNNEQPESALEFQEAMSIEEVSRSVRKGRYVNDGKMIPKVHVVLKNTSHPYAKASSKVKERQERKKVQNKEAAARYRIKKRMEEKGLSGEVSDLQSEQKKLKRKHDDLQSEIKYLKSLMREILQKRGILK